MEGLVPEIAPISESHRKMEAMHRIDSLATQPYA